MLYNYYRSQTIDGLYTLIVRNHPGRLVLKGEPVGVHYYRAKRVVDDVEGRRSTSSRQAVMGPVTDPTYIDGKGSVQVQMYMPLEATHIILEQKIAGKWVEVYRGRELTYTPIVWDDTLAFRTRGYARRSLTEYSNEVPYTPIVIPTPVLTFFTTGTTLVLDWEIEGMGYYYNIYKDDELIAEVENTNTYSVQNAAYGRYWVEAILGYESATSNTISYESTLPKLHWAPFTDYARPSTEQLRYFIPNGDAFMGSSISPNSVANFFQSPDGSVWEELPKCDMQVYAPGIQHDLVAVGYRPSGQGYLRYAAFAPVSGGTSDGRGIYLLAGVSKVWVSCQYPKDFPLGQIYCDPVSERTFVVNNQIARNRFPSTNFQWVLTNSVGNLGAQKITRHNESLMVGITSTRDTMIFSNDDGDSWNTRVTNMGLGTLPLDIATNGAVIVVASSNTLAYSIDNGGTWAAPTGLNLTGITSVTCAGGKFVALGTQGYAESDDGMTWTVTPYEAGARRDIVIGNGTKFMAIGSAANAWTVTGSISSEV